jgi:predicted membrane channel-forming protein YqfA (hemolysin III family)
MLAVVAVFCASAAYELDKFIGGPGGLPAVFALAAFYLLPAAVSLWAVADAREREWTRTYDFGSFMFFLWPVLLPIYLFQTRGLRGFGVFALFLCAQVAGILFAMLMGYPLSIQP